MVIFSRMIHCIILIFILNFTYVNQLFAKPVEVKIPVGVFLNADKNGSDVILKWNPTCDTSGATFHIQESLDRSSWLTVYSGTGSSGGVIARMQSNLSTVSMNSVVGDICTPDYDPRSTALFNRSGSVYYYRIKACNGLACTEYSSPITVTSLPISPSSISISKLTDASFNVQWSSVLGVNYYTVERQHNNSSFSSLSTTSATSLVDTPQDVGTYRYRVAACTNVSFPPICSNYISSSAVESVGLVVVSYKYDVLGRLRLVSDSINADRNYDYDSAGNRTIVEGN